MNGSKDYGIRADAIRRARIRKRWTQEDLARNAGLSLGQISRIESGRIDAPHFSTIAKIAQALGVADEDLIEWLESAPLRV